MKIATITLVSAVLTVGSCFGAGVAHDVGWRGMSCALVMATLFLALWTYAAATVWRDGEGGDHG